MRSKFKWISTLIIALVMQVSFSQEKTVSGVVTDQLGMSIPGVNVTISKGTKSTQTDMDGKFKIDAEKGQILVFTFTGMKTIQQPATNGMVVKMVETAVELEAVVVTALGVKKDVKKVTHAVQQITAEKLNITQAVDVKAALAGKIAGVQINGQAGSKLGSTGKIRLRGALSLSADKDPLYVLDGVYVDANSVDMENIANISVLKGANATALYGQRAEFGVILMTSKKGSKKLSVEISSAMVFDKVAYTPKYQNQYGQGYDGDASFGSFDFAANADYLPEWSVFQGKRYLVGENNYADESWGPKFDGQDYIPWYSWWKGSSYYGSTAKYVAQNNNIKDFFDVGVTRKNSIAVSGGSDKYSARFSYSNLNQNGITPNTEIMRHYINSSFSAQLTDKFNVDAFVNVTAGNILGEFDDSYGNQTTGSFNSWFGRDLDVSKLKELRNLETPDGYHASWNWWGPDYYATEGGDFKKPAFWYNSYTYLERYEFRQKPTDISINISPSYKFNNNLSAKFSYSRSQNIYDRKYTFPYSLSKSAGTSLYNDWQNAFGVYHRGRVESNYELKINYKKSVNNFSTDGFVGGSILKTNYNRSSTEINPNTDVGGLLIPDVYQFSNASITPTTNTFEFTKDVRSIFLTNTFGFKDILYVDGTIRNDWNSALTTKDPVTRTPINKNGYLTWSTGVSFVFDKLLNLDFLNSGKLRGGIARLGGDIDATATDQVLQITRPYLGSNPATFNSNIVVDPALKAPENTNKEIGLDLKMFKNRFGLSLTYYNETRKDDILEISTPTSSLYSKILTNAGESNRSGLELSLDATILKNTASDFEWNLAFNYAKNKTEVKSIGRGLTATQFISTNSDFANANGADDFAFVSIVHEEGKEWGQIKGNGIKRDTNGNPILNASGLFTIESGKYLGSVLPNFTGGFINTFKYKNLNLTASFDFQSGGKFFSLSEMWGNSSGLLEATAALNDRGANVRDTPYNALAPVDGENGGVHVKGVDAAGGVVDTYVDAHSYFSQFFGNKLAEPFVHDASYFKLRDINLSYTFSGKLFKNQIQSLTIGVVGRNLLLISVSDDNIHSWDPSELSGNYGESGQLPGTRSFGLNVKLTL